MARELARKVYHLTQKPEFAKDYGLKRQIQDAAGSSMHNADCINYLKRYEERKATNVNREPDNLSSCQTYSPERPPSSRLRRPLGWTFGPDSR